MKQLEKYRWLWLGAAYFAITVVLYRHTVYAKLLFDWNTWAIHYIDAGWAGLPGCYGDKSIHWGYHLFNMLQWKAFGLNSMGWFIVATLLHAVNAMLLALLTEKILRITNLANRFLIAVVAGLLWLVSPYHSETVVWGATTQYLTTFLLMLAASFFFIRFAETNRYKFLWLVYACFLCALLTFEVSIMLPFVLLVVWLITYNTAINNIPTGRYVKLFLVPGVAVIALYFIANKLRIGGWVGHYGAAAHLNTDLGLIIPNFSKYLLKLLYVPLYFTTFHQRDTVYAFLEADRQVWLQGTVYVVALSVLTFLFFNAGKKWRVIIGFLALFCVVLVPVVNMYFMYYKDIEQDRYVYFASAFFYVALTIFFFAVARRWAAIPLLVCLFISLQFLHKYTHSWSQAGRMAMELTNSFKWDKPTGRVFVLLTPDTYDGAVSLRSAPESTLGEMLYVHRRIDVRDSLVEVYQWNVMSPNDSATCEVIDSASLQVKLYSPGGWLWFSSMGARPLKNQHFETELDQWYPWFKVRIKDRRPDDVFIYAVNDHWKQVENF